MQDEDTVSNALASSSTPPPTMLVTPSQHTPRESEDDIFATLRGNRNVALTIAYNFLDGACYSLWGALLLPILIGKLSGDGVVGNAAAAAGVAQLVAATVAGYYGNAVRRQTFVRVGSGCGLVGVGAFLFAALQAARSASHFISSSSSSSSLSSSLSAGEGSSSVSLVPGLAVVFIFAQACWGAYVGLVSTSAEALFADSVRSGARTSIYSFKWIVQTLCYVVGYLAALGLLLTLGNDWDVVNICRVMVVGLLAHPAALAVLWLLKDSYALSAGEEGEEGEVGEEGEEGDDGGGRERGTRSPREENSSGSGNDQSPLLRDLHQHQHQQEGKEPVAPQMRQRPSQEEVATPKAATTTITARPVGSDNGAASPEQGNREDEIILVVSHGSGSNGSGREDSQLSDRIAAEVHAQKQRYRMRQSGRSLRLLRWWHAVVFHLCSWQAVPFLVCLVDFLMALGSGMTLLYFPLFFTGSVGATPVQMYTAYLLSTCLTACTSHLARVAARRWLNRLPAVLLVRIVGTTLLLLMGLLPVYSTAANAITSESRRPHATLLFLGLFVGRNACMNAVLGMTRSIIMDAVAQESRAKWSAFESFSSFTWAGSAALGAILVEAKGYQFNFTVTACFHFVAGVLLLPAAVGAHRIERILSESGAG